MKPLRTRIWIMVSLALGVRLEGLAQDAATPPDSKQLKMVKWAPDFQIITDDVTIPVEKIAERSPIISTMSPMGFIVDKGELRDLVAYMKTLQSEKN